jgi:serine/threonine protein kinase
MSEIEEVDIDFFGGDNGDIDKLTYDDKIQFINQGTYGCVFRPAINCKGNLLKPSFITKIQSEKSNSDKETHIGYIIKKIKGYSEYFAPILKTCNISLANIKNDEIKKCDFIDNKTTKIISNKMKYVGDKTLFDYFTYILEEKPDIITDILFDCYLHLLEGIHILKKNNIIHYDLKENNIMYDETQDYPIIIDFGLSFETSNLRKYKELVEAFYVYAPDYKPWCFEINIICYIIHNVEENDLDNNISISLLNNVIDDLFDKNKMFSHFTPFRVSNAENVSPLSLETPPDVGVSNEKWRKENNENYRKSLKDFINLYSDLSYKELIDELLSFSYSWDNYSLAVIFLYSIYQLKLERDMFPFNKLIKTLKQIIFSTPNNRIGIKDTIDIVYDIYDDMI